MRKENKLRYKSASTARWDLGDTSRFQYRLFTFSRDSSHADLTATEFMLLKLLDFAAFIDLDDGQSDEL